MHYCVLMAGPRLGTREAEKALRTAALEYGWLSYQAGGRYAGRLVSKDGQRQTSMRVADFDMAATEAAELADVATHLCEIDTFPERERALFLEAYGLKIGEGVAEYRQRRPWAPAFLLWAGTVVITRGEKDHRAWADQVARVLDQVVALDRGDWWLTLIDVHAGGGA